MTNKEYSGHPNFYKVLEEVKDLHDIKNRQYASSDNPLGNFFRGSQIVKKLFHPDLQKDPYRLALAYCVVLSTKQFDGLIELVAENKTNTPDSLQEKMRDVLVYMGIAECIESDRSKLNE